VLTAEVNALLSLLDTANEGASNTPSIDHEAEVAYLMWLNDTSELDERALLFEKRHVGIEIMLS